MDATTQRSRSLSRRIRRQLVLPVVGATPAPLGVFGQTWQIAIAPCCPLWRSPRRAACRSARFRGAGEGRRFAGRMGWFGGLPLGSRRSGLAERHPWLCMTRRWSLRQTVVERSRGATLRLPMGNLRGRCQCAWATLRYSSALSRCQYAARVADRRSRTRQPGAFESRSRCDGHNGT